jgi:hypothetical protein
LVDPAIAEAAAAAERTGSLPEPPRNTPSTGHRRNAQRKQPAASQACRPKRSPNFRRRGAGECGPGGSRWRSSPWSIPPAARPRVIGVLDNALTEARRGLGED